MLGRQCTTGDSRGKALKIVVFSVTQPTLVFYHDPNFFMDLADTEMFQGQIDLVWFDILDR